MNYESAQDYYVTLLMLKMLQKWKSGLVSRKNLAMRDCSAMSFHRVSLKRHFMSNWLLRFCQKKALVQNYGNYLRNFYHLVDGVAHHEFRQKKHFFAMWKIKHLKFLIDENQYELAIWFHKKRCITTFVNIWRIKTLNSLDDKLVMEKIENYREMVLKVIIGFF
jgi:hypothetical protein